MKRRTRDFILKFREVFLCRETSLSAHGMKSIKSRFSVKIVQFFWKKNVNDWKVFCITSKKSWRYFLSLTVPLIDQGISHPLVLKGGGGLWDPTLRKPLFQRNFMMNATLYSHTLKRKKNDRFKMATKLSIFISRHFDFGENLKKKHFRKGGFSMKFGSYRRFKIHLNYWNKNWKCTILWDIFPRPLKMLIYAKKWRSRCELFFRQKKRFHEGDNYKKYRSKICLDNSEYAKNTCGVPWNPPWSLRC